jgi:hypothetical protein
MFFSKAYNICRTIARIIRKSFLQLSIIIFLFYIVLNGVSLLDNSLLFDSKYHEKTIENIINEVNINEEILAISSKRLSYKTLIYMTNQIITQLRDFFSKKHKVDIKPSELKSHMFLFLDSTIVNPSFSSQTKEKLITEVKDFGTSFEISNKIIQLILKSEIVNSILDWIERKKEAEESKLKRDLNKKLTKIKVEKLIDAKGRDRWKCSLGIFEGDCLQEDTLIRVIREGDITDVKIKDAKIDDIVITHNNSFSNIYAITKKIKKKSVIKLKNNEELISSKTHKWFVYDIIKNEFYFESVENINKHTHKIVKNYLAFTDSLLKIEYNDGYVVKLSSGDIINTNPDHKFAVYDIILNKFIMCKTIDIDIDKHLIVNTFKL